MRALGVIPARGGSKQLPGKNLMRIEGKTLIQWAIESALAAKSLAEIVVTSDDPEMRATAAQYLGVGAISRPANLATDECGMVPVLQHAVRILGGAHDLVVCLQPTSPFRTGEDIDQTVALVREDIESAQTVTPAPCKMDSMMYVDPEDGAVTHEFPTAARVDYRRQDGPTVYIPSGAVYVTRRSVLMDEGYIVGFPHRAHVVPWERSVNINTELDLRIARMLAHRTPESTWSM